MRNALKAFIAQVSYDGLNDLAWKQAARQQHRPTSKQQQLQRYRKNHRNRTKAKKNVIERTLVRTQSCFAVHQKPIQVQYTLHKT